MDNKQAAKIRAYATLFPLMEQTADAVDELKGEFKFIFGMSSEEAEDVVDESVRDIANSMSIADNLMREVGE